MSAKQKQTKTRCRQDQSLIEKEEKTARRIGIGTFVVVLFIEFLLLMLAFWLLLFSFFTDASNYRPFYARMFLVGSVLWSLFPSTIIALVVSRKRKEDYTKKFCATLLISILIHVITFFLLALVGKKDLKIIW